MKKTPFQALLVFKPITLIWGLALLLAACNEDQIIRPRTKTPPPTTPTNPGTGQPDPEDPNPGLPDSGQQPNPVPTGKFVQLKWTEMDFQRVDYDETGLVTRYVSQYNSQQGSTTVSNFTYEFHYDANKRLVKETSNVHGTVLFFYNGNLLAKAIEYDKLERPLKEYHYTYQANGKLEERITYKVDLNENKTEYLKQVYKYDERGNLVVLEEYFKNNAAGRFDLSTKFFFEDFDDKKAPIPFLATFPYLPQAITWINNPRVKYARNRDGYELVGRERYGYTYNSNGYPASQTRSVTVGNGRPDFTYSGQYVYNMP